MGSWRKVWEFSQPLTVTPGDPPDEKVTYGVAKMLPVIVWDRDSKQRRIVAMRWGLGDLAIRGPLQAAISR